MLYQVQWPQWPHLADLPICTFFTWPSRCPPRHCRTTHTHAHLKLCMLITAEVGITKYENNKTLNRSNGLISTIAVFSSHLWGHTTVVAVVSFLVWRHSCWVLRWYAILILLLPSLWINKYTNFSSTCTNGDRWICWLYYYCLFVVNTIIKITVIL